MANLSRENVKRIIQDAPIGVSQAEIVAELINKGHSLEGFSPEGQDGGTFSNVADALVSFGKGALKATGQELQHLGSLVTNPLERISGRELGLPEESFEREGTAEKAGGVTAQIASFAVPGAKAAKVGKGIQAARGGASGLLSRAGVEGATAGAVSATQQGGFNRETALVAGVGAAFPFLGGVSRSLGKGAARFFFGSRGLSGIQTRFNDPKTTAQFLKTARRQEGGNTLMQLVKRVNSSVDDVRQRSGQAFKEAEEKIVSTKIPQARSRVVDESKQVIKEFLDEDVLSDDAISVSGVTEQSSNVIKKIVRILDDFTDETTEGVLNTKRRIAKQWKGTGKSGESDAIVTRLTNNLNDIIEEVDPAFRNASRDFSGDRKFLDLVRANITGKSKDNLDQTANKLFRLAKDLDDPFRAEGAETVLRELEARTSLPLTDTLRALAAADNLSPQAAQGLRAGIVREIARLLQVGVSSAAGGAGRLNQNAVTRSVIKNLREATRAAILQASGGGE